MAAGTGWDGVIGWEAELCFFRIPGWLMGAMPKVAPRFLRGSGGLGISIESRCAGIGYYGPPPIVMPAREGLRRPTKGLWQPVRVRLCCKYETARHTVQMLLPGFIRINVAKSAP